MFFTMKLTARDLSVKHHVNELTPVKPEPTESLLVSLLV